VAGWPLAASAQSVSKVARIGFLGAASASGYANQVEGFRSGLREVGYTEGSNISIVYRWAEGRYERLPDLAADLVSANVDVIVTHGAPATLAAKKATETVPIVVAIIGDPIASGIITSLARPGGNITGSGFFSPELGAKRIEFLKEVMSDLSQVAFLYNEDNPTTLAVFAAMEATARPQGIKLLRFPVRRSTDLESAIERIVQARAQAMVIQDDGMLLENTRTIAGLAIKQGLLTAGGANLHREGGLIGYGINVFVLFRRAATFVDKILKGAKPADIPFEQATRFETSVSSKTAKTLGINIPNTLLVRADEVVE